MLPQVSEQIACLVVDTGIEAQLVHNIVALGPAAGYADDTATLDLGELAGDTADGAGRG